MISRLGKVLVLVVLFTATLCLERQPLPLSEARTPDTSGACADLRYLMANELTPSSLIVGGGVITLSGTSASVQGGVSAQDIGDYWVIDVQRNRNQYNQPINGRLTLIVSGPGQNINLEAALFRGMVSIPDMDGKAGYQPVVFNLGRAFTIDEDGVYTIVVQRSQIADEIQTTPYQMNIQVQDLIPGSTPLDTAIRDESTGLPLQPRFQDGRQIFPFPSGTEVEVSVGAVNGASSGNGTNVIFGPGQNVLLASWAAQISFAGAVFRL